MGVAPVRRISNRFIRFLYSHRTIGISCYVAIAIHSTSGLILLLVPFVMLMIDYIMRQVTTKTGEATLQYFPESKTTHVTFKDMKMNHEAGSYCFVYCADVGKFGWHPFSIASKPNSNMEFYIKDMGNGKKGATWTNRLGELAKSDKASNVSMSLYGPYGVLSVDLGQYDNLVFVAGGIGVTPFLSTLKHLKELKESGRLDRVKGIHLIWTVRHAEMESFLKDALPELKTYNFHVSTKDGRLNVENALTEALKPVPNEGSNPYHAAILACGPEGLVKSARNYASTNKYHWHEETFFW